MSDAIEPLVKRDSTSEQDKQAAELKKALAKNRRDNEKRHCKNPKHPAIFVNAKGQCPRSHRCQDKGTEGCTVGTIT